MKRNSHIKAILLITIGLIVTVIGYQSFLDPYSISVGGLTGISIILNKNFGIPNTTSLFLMNFLLFVWGLKKKGCFYILRTFIAMMALGVLLDQNIPCLATFTPHSRTEAMIWGSILTGCGYGMICATDSSTGGSDLLAMIIVKYFSFLTISMVMNAVDLCVIITTSIIEGLENLMFSLTAMLLCNTMIDLTAYSLDDNAELPHWIKEIQNRVKIICEHLPSMQFRKRLPAKRSWRPALAVIIATGIIILIYIRLPFLTEVFKPIINA